MIILITQLFNNLFDSGKIKLDKKYFSHILDSLAIVPSQNYCSKLSRLKLLYYKICFLFTFYRIKNKASALENFKSLLKLLFIKLFKFFSAFISYCITSFASFSVFLCISGTKYQKKMRLNLDLLCYE